MKKKKARTHVFYAIMRAIFKPIFILKYHVKYIGRENVPKTGPYIIASNHMQSADPIFLGAALRRQIMFMAKAELFEKQPKRWFFLRLGAFPVERGKSDRNAINHFEDILRDGYLMGIFIEGTRSKTGDFLPPKNGVSLIAYQTKTPVIPVCISDKGKNKIVHFGKPLSLDEMGLINGGAREFRFASRTIMDHIKALREQDLSD